MLYKDSPIKEMAGLYLEFLLSYAPVNDVSLSVRLVIIVKSQSRMSVRR